MTTGTSVLPELRIAVANFRPGGVDAGSTGRWDQMMRWEKAVSALRAWQPHLVLCQEISSAEPGGLRASLWATANALGMFPLLGPPGAVSRHHQQDIGDAEHQALILNLDGPRAARAIPPEPRQ